MPRFFTPLLLVLGLAACGTVYTSPQVDPVLGGDAKVRVMQITPETVIAANRSSYAPKALPAAFFQTPGSGSGLRGAGAVPDPALSDPGRPRRLETRLPPPAPERPYTIGVGDVLLLATRRGGSTVEELSGLLAATNARQGYTVQDDGAIAVPNVGRIEVAGQTLEEAESTLFRRLVENGIDPTFSLEIAEFNSKKVSIGGAVAQPAVVPVRLTPLNLDEALSAVGGVTVADRDLASVRLYRDGTLYQVPLTELYARSGLRRIRLQDGDSVFVDETYALDRAQAYFAEQIRLAEFRQGARVAALNALEAEVSIRRGNQQDARDNFRARLELGAVARDFVYLAGEVGQQSRYPLPFGTRASLADALYAQGGGIPTETGDVAEIYVLRGSQDPREFGAITAWHLNARDASNLLMATRFELRPNDVVFVAEQPVTRWNRVIRQITPSLITTSVSRVAK